MLLGFFASGRKAGGFDDGIQFALERLLVDPNFLFRIERDPAGTAPGTVYPVPDLELATRLSTFLWGSLPDSQLMDLASRGKLGQPQVLDQQTRRLLADAQEGAQPNSLHPLVVEPIEPTRAVRLGIDAGLAATPTVAGAGKVPQPDRRPFHDLARQRLRPLHPDPPVPIPV